MEHLLFARSLVNDIGYENRFFSELRINFVPECF